jgi:hypothetical protein
MEGLSGRAPSRAKVARLPASDDDLLSEMRAALRTSMVASVVLAAMWLMLSPAGADHPRARAAATCNNTFVRATVKNQTTLPMAVWFFGFGLTNAVCNDQHPRGAAGLGGSVASRRQPLQHVGDDQIPAHKWRPGRAARAR